MSDQPIQQNDHSLTDKQSILNDLRPRQRRFVQELPNHNSLSEAARAAGYSKTTAKVTIYRQIRSPKLRRAIALYHGLGDLGLGELGAGTLIELLTGKNTKDEVKVNASKLALQVAGKLKNVNLNSQISAHIEITPEILAKLFYPSNQDK